MTRAWLFVILLTAPACSKHADPLPPPSDQHAACASALSGAMQRAKDDTLATEHRVPGPAEARMATSFMEAQARLMTGTCTDTRWAPEALACFEAAKTDLDNKHCLEMLTPAQTDAWHSAAQAAFGAGVHHKP